MRVLLIVVLLVIAAGATKFIFMSGTSGVAFHERTLTLDSASYRYRVYLPAESGDSAKAKRPVVLFLHGAGERGSDNWRQTSVGLGAAIEQNPSRFPFVAVFPQCPHGRWWTDPNMQALALKSLEITMKEFNADPERVYLTGLSMGGYGSWRIVANNPGKFAAIAVVCGGILPPPGLRVEDNFKGPNGEDPYAWVAKQVGKTPVWVFHGGADPVVPVGESRKMVEALKAAAANVKYTEYQGVGHNSWDKAYSEAGLTDWFLSARLQASSPKPDR